MSDKLKKIYLKVDNKKLIYQLIISSKLRKEKEQEMKMKKKM